jgi:hypothetical protein
MLVHNVVACCGCKAPNISKLHHHMLLDMHLIQHHVVLPVFYCCYHWTAAAAASYPWLGKLA